MRLSRPNRGNRLHELLKDGFSDEDEIDDAWKEAGDDRDASVGSCSDDADSDFSATEHTSTLSGGSKVSWESDRKPKVQATKRPRRQRKTSSIPQHVRLRDALERADGNSGPLDVALSPSRGKRLRSKITKATVSFFSGSGSRRTHVLGV